MNREENFGKNNKHSEQVSPRKTPPEGMAQLCTLFVRSGRSIDRTAAVLGISANAICVLLFRAHQFLYEGKSNDSQAA